MPTISLYSVRDFVDGVMNDRIAYALTFHIVIIRISVIAVLLSVVPSAVDHTESHAAACVEPEYVIRDHGIRSAFITHNAPASGV